MACAVWCDSREIRQVNPRYWGDTPNRDMYTPRAVRGQGAAREALCPLCTTYKWLRTRKSVYWYGECAAIPESRRLKITLTGTDKAQCLERRIRRQEPHAVRSRYRLPDAPALPATGAVRHAKHGAGMRASLHLARWAAAVSPHCARICLRLGWSMVTCRTRAAFASAARRGCGSRGARTSTNRRRAGSATRTNAGAAMPTASKTLRPQSMAS